ncbi:MAG: hypothetical protein K0S25_999 [Bacillus sp. (in: firmicutes)]|nr:hypothetical protein [Bacillus sp. (in: firmicutes)]
MENDSKDDRKKIFISELNLLAKEDYITSNQFNVIAKAHHQYYYDLGLERNEQKEPIKQVIKDKKPVVVTTPKPKIEKKKLTADQMRERNITWLLNLGVILLLIGGLFVATSNWESMSNLMKSSSVGLVSLLFFGIAYLSRKVLKIEKTELAFVVLGSLFLPIFLLSLGWFKLLGEYLSYTGEGRYIFGFISGLLVVPVYITFAKRLASRLFVWFSYLAISVTVAFLLSAFHLDKDWFYFGIMLYNVIAVMLFHRFKQNEALALFTKELVAFAQIQLVISSLLTMIFYDNHVLNGINILTSAAVYLAMVYVSGKKEYHFIFTAMVVYGAYQLIEHSVLELLGPVLYVLIGIAFLFLPKFLDDRFPWKKIFQLTSAIVSGLVFLAISFDSVVMNMNNPSWALLLAYLLLAGQFIYLASETKSRLFTYLSPIFFMASYYELVLILDQYLHFDNLIFPTFLVGFIQFITCGFYIKFSQISVIKKSSRDVGLATMFLALLLELLTFNWLELGFVLCLLGFILYLSHRVEERPFYKISVPWLLPISLALAFTAFGEEGRSTWAFFHGQLGLSMNTILGSLISFLAYLGWGKTNEKALAKNSFYMGQVFYTLACFLALVTNVNELWMRPLVLCGGVGVYIAFYRFEKYKWLPYLISSLSLITYFTIVQSVYLKLNVPNEIQSIEYTLGGAILLVTSYLLKNKEVSIANGFAWVGQLFLPGALLITYFQYGETSIWSFLIATMLYSASTYFVHTEWITKTFLYSAFSTMFMVVVTTMLNLETGLDLEYSFLITSLIISGFWMLAKQSFKVRTIYYIVPFSVVGIVAFIVSYPYDLTLFLVTLVYSIGLIVILTVVNWKISRIIPLFLIFAATQQFLQLNGIVEEWKLVLVSLMGAATLVLGSVLHRELFVVNEKEDITQLDVFTITAFLYFGSGYFFQSAYVWTNFVPGLLISISLWLQKSRVPKNWSMWVKLFAGVYLLEPYYSTISALEIPSLFEREVFVLPWVAVVIYLRRCLAGKHRRLINEIQWAVLIMVSLLLIQDGLESSTIYDALILGTLSLISILGGMFLRVKSYFVVGVGVLLLNVFLQTRPYWGNLPWWGYLLISGSILISVASYNEWHKQKTAKGETTVLTKIKQKLLVWINKWD